MRTMGRLWAGGRAHAWVTAAVALVLNLSGLTQAVPTPWWDASGVTPQPWWHLGPLAVITGAMLAKYRWPERALAIGGACAVVDLMLGGSVGVWICLVDLIYYVGLRGSQRLLTGLGIGFAAVVAGVGVLVAVLGANGPSVASAMLLVGGVLLMPLWWAVEVRRGHPLGPMASERDHLEAERNAALIRLHEADRREAVVEERRRMARELHDVVSAHVSSIALHSGAALAGSPDEGRDRRVLESVRQTSVAALEDLSTMVRLLRSDAPPSGSAGDRMAAELTPPPGLREVITRAEQDGLEVTVVNEVPEVTDEQVHGVLSRVLQESLANASRHGDGAARVEFSADSGEVCVTVTNRHDGVPAVTPWSTGTGLVSIRERVDHAGGTVVAGADGGHWRVRVRLPASMRLAERRTP